jgi:hypothetical protein
MASMSKNTPTTTNAYNITVMTIKINFDGYLTPKMTAKFNPT